MIQLSELTQEPVLIVWAFYLNSDRSGLARLTGKIKVLYYFFCVCASLCTPHSCWGNSIVFGLPIATFRLTTSTNLTTSTYDFLETFRLTRNTSLTTSTYDFLETFRLTRSTSLTTSTYDFLETFRLTRSTCSQTCTPSQSKGL